MSLAGKAEVSIVNMLPDGALGVDESFGRLGSNDEREIAQIPPHPRAQVISISRFLDGDCRQIMLLLLQNDRHHKGLKESEVRRFY